jgi:hypothetical protein
MAAANRESDMRLRLALSLAMFVIAATFAQADDWPRYVNEKYGYAIDLPPAFGPLSLPYIGDGGVATAEAGNAELSVWGASLGDDSFAADVSSRIDSAVAEGWDISYRKATKAGTSWSGARGERILYSRAIPACPGEAAYFQIEYDRAALAEYDAVVARLVKSLTAPDLCG